MATAKPGSGYGRSSHSGEVDAGGRGSHEDGSPRRGGKVPITEDLREYLLSYFADLNPIESLRRDPKEELRLKNALDHLHAPSAR